MIRRLRDAAPPPERRPKDPWPVLTACASLVYLGFVIAVVLARIRYPYALEWVEGAMFLQVSRLRSGLPLFTAPSLEFVSLNYPPLFLWLSALSSALVGNSLFALRLVSAVSSAVSFILIWKLVRFESGRRAPAWLAVGLFAAMFRVGGAWLDIARVDSLQLALMLAGVAVARMDRSRWRMPILAGTLFAAAFLAKQSVTVAIAPLMLWQIGTERRRGLALAVVFAALVAIAVVILDAESNGWFRYYVFTLNGFYSVDPGLRAAFPIDGILRPFWPVLVLGVSAALRVGPRPATGTLGFYVSLAVGFVGLGWVLSSYRGGYANVLMPAHAAVAMLGALAFARLTLDPPSVRRAGIERYAACVLVLVQLAVLAWNPLPQVPRPADRAAGDQLVEELRQTPGRVWVSSHGYLAALAGRPTYALNDFMMLGREGHYPRERELLPVLRDSLRSHAWQALILDNRDWLIDEAMAAGYRPTGRVFRGDVFWPVTGYHTRPDWVYAPAGPDTVRSRP